MTFTAVDFETANRYPDSACSVGLVRVTDGRITKKRTFLLRPPYDRFEFSHIHGITLRDVRQAPTFRERWKEIAPFFDGIDFAVAHNAPFDRRVLEACCRTFAVTPPEVEFRCTVRLSRSVLRIRPADLSNVCRELFIPLEHHDAGSDAEACARIMVEVLRREGERQR